MMRVCTYPGTSAWATGRLSIIDLNTEKQPFSNETGTVWIIFNGEIYNYRELRADLLKRGHTFSTETDTEAIVHLYEEYHEGLLEKLRGMYFEPKMIDALLRDAAWQHNHSSEIFSLLILELWNRQFLDAHN